MKSIDATPSWAWAMSVYIHALNLPHTKKNQPAKDGAIKELQELAKRLDKQSRTFAKLKKKIKKLLHENIVEDKKTDHKRLLTIIGGIHDML